MNSHDVYLRHILDAIVEIESMVNGVSFDGFQENTILQKAVFFELAVIGEASNKLGSNFQSTHTNIPFAEMVGMRNRLVHEYFGINVEAVWKTCQEDLPTLQKRLKEIIND